MVTVASPTPVRLLEVPLTEGCRRLSEAGIEYRDGSETRLLEILGSAVDVSSTSDELLNSAIDWPQRYHLDPARSHVLRALQLDPASRVLEVGAGCGALSRILGERCGLVDSLEPMPERAACARLRTRDLPNVEVFVGTIGDIPVLPAYDVVMIMGVLEYVGAGSPDSEIYRGFLRQAAALIRPGGSLILGIENRLGVKYLCGAPEDHSGRPFESVEGYDQRSPARTFSRRELEGFLRDVALEPTTLGLFPDYKLTRLVFSDDLLESEPQLAAAIPHFPSPDWSVSVPRVANEARVWANLIEAGLGTDTANSFVMLAHQGDGPSPLWSADTLAVYYPSAGRKMAFAPETSIVRQGGETVFRRRPVAGPPPHDQEVGLSLLDSDFLSGDDMVELMARTASDEELVPLFASWMDALDQSLEDDRLATADLLPHNAVVTPTGKVAFVDAKWILPNFGRDEIVARAAHQTAWRLAGATSPSRWTVLTFESLVLHIGTFLGLSLSGEWLVPALDREAAFQAQISVVGPHDGNVDGVYARIRAELQAQLAQPLSALEGARESGKSASLEELQDELNRTLDMANRSEARASDAAARAAEAQTRAIETETRLQAAEGTATNLRHEVDALHQTRTFRYSRLPRRLYEQLRRSGTSH